jgi:hypothetical protein
VNREDAFDRFRFNQYALLDEHIESKRLVAAKTFVGNRDDALRFGRESAELKFAEQTPLVDALDESGPLSLCTSMAEAMMCSVRPFAFSKSGCIGKNNFYRSPTEDKRDRHRLNSVCPRFGSCEKNQIIGTCGSVSAS